MQVGRERRVSLPETDNAIPLNQRTLQFWCTHPLSVMTENVKGRCETLREQVHRIINATALSFDERYEKLEQLIGKTTPRQHSVVDLAMENQHPEIAASILLGVLGSGAHPGDIRAAMARAGINEAAVAESVRRLTDNGSGWSAAMADEIQELRRDLSQALAEQAAGADAPLLVVAGRTETADPLPRRSGGM